jgi:cation diffusion facilitator family transporter
MKTVPNVVEQCAGDNAAMQVRSFLLVSALTAIVTIALKTAAWWFTASVGLLSDAMESFVNLAAALFGLWMVTVAARPADPDHPFGHAKAEYFSSGFEGLLILGAAVAIAVAAAERLLNPQPVDQLGLGMLLSVLSSALNGALAVAMRRAATRHRSIALEADARHLMADVTTSAGVLVGMAAVAATGWSWLDPLIALGVAANITREGTQLVRRSTEGLMDHALDASDQLAIDAVLRRFVAEPGHEGLRPDDVKTRRAAQQRHCELHLHVPASWSVARAMRSREQLAAALFEAVPGLRVTIELLPVGEEPLSAASSTSAGALRP